VRGHFLSSDRILCTSPPHHNTQSVQRIQVRDAVLTNEIQLVELRQWPQSSPNLEKDHNSSYFTLKLEGYETIPISSNASAAQVRHSLEQLPPTGGNGSLTVDKSHFLEDTYIDGIRCLVTSWRVMFMYRIGNVPALVANSFGLEKSDIQEAVTVRTLLDGSTGPAEAEEQVLRIEQSKVVTEIQRITIVGPSKANEVQEIWLTSTGPLAGFFKLSYNTQPAVLLNAEAEATQVKALIQSIDGTGFVDVTRHRSGTRGYYWSITFLSTEKKKPQAVVTSFKSQSLYD
jgi:hypothetical protein